VGIRRHTATLRRLGQLQPQAVATHAQALWVAAIDRSAPPAHPGSGLAGPYASCSSCPRPCTVRAVVASGAVGTLRRATDGGGAPVVQRALALAEGLTVELVPTAGVAVAQATGYCAAVAEAFKHGHDLALLQAVQGATGGGARA
jgi:hypothetical protein